MKYEPHPYQHLAYDHVMKHPRSLLLLDMGLGKTIITLTVIDDLLHDYFEVRKVLVIAPLRVAQDTWPSEVKKWDHLKHLRLSLILGSPKQRIAAIEADADVYIINRENVEWLVSQLKQAWPFDMVVVDEVSSFKSPTAKRFRALRSVMPATTRFIGLTGTPASNGLIDLWSQLYLVDRGERLGKTVTMYRNRYFKPGWKQGNVVYNWSLTPGAEQAIHAKIADVCMSLKAEDWLKVPEQIDIDVKVKFPPKLMKEYRKLERDCILELEQAQLGKGQIVASTAAVVTGKLMQFANGAIYDENRSVHPIHDLKLDALEELVEEANGKPVMIFYAFKHDLDRIRKRLDIYDVRTLEDSKDIEDWNAGKIQVLLLHPASAGHGLNLQHGGNIVIWYGLTFSLELYQQANARLHRQGQTQKVLVHHILVEGTVDEDVKASLASKDVSQSRLIEAVKARIAKEMTHSVLPNEHKQMEDRR